MNLPASSHPSSDPARDAAIAAGLPQVRLSRWLAVSSLLALVVLSVAWELYLAPIKPGGSLLALKALPLCVPIAGLLKNRMYTYRWVSLLVWLYFTEGVVRAYSDRAPSSYYALLEVGLCLALFAGCALHVRLRLRNAKSTLQSADASAETTPVAP
ncbi:MAG: DUF2069 domain-containing protein [Rhodoferax sp.]